MLVDAATAVFLGNKFRPRQAIPLDCVDAGKRMTPRWWKGDWPGSMGWPGWCWFLKSAGGVDRAMLLRYSGARKWARRWPLPFLSTAGDRATALAQRQRYARAELALARLAAVTRLMRWRWMRHRKFDPKRHRAWLPTSEGNGFRLTGKKTLSWMVLWVRPFCCVAKDRTGLTPVSTFPRRGAITRNAQKHDRARDSGGSTSTIWSKRRR